MDLHQDLMEAQLRLAEAQSDVDILEKRIEETKTRLENKKQEVSERKTRHILRLIQIANYE